MKTRLGYSEAYDVAAIEPSGAVSARMGGSWWMARIDTLWRLPRRSGGCSEKKRVFWFEEPFPPEEIDSYIALRPKLKVPLAAGENDFGVQGFREMLRAGALGVAQPDACRAGGIIGMRSDCAEWRPDSGVGIGTHTWSDAVALNGQCSLRCRHAERRSQCEVDQTGNPFIEELSDRTAAYVRTECYIARSSRIRH